MHMTRVDHRKDRAEEAFDIDDAGARKLLAVHDKLVKSASELTGRRKRLDQGEDRR